MSRREVAVKITECHKRLEIEGSKLKGSSRSESGGPGCIGCIRELLKERIVFNGGDVRRW